MSDGSTDERHNGENGGHQRQNNPLDEEIFQRDLNEVHLLIDFVSGRPDKNLADLALPDPSEKWTGSPGYRRPNLDPGEAVKRITQIRYPPAGPPKKDAENAALLLLAKDELTELASPARGLTIAYTAMFVGLERGFVRRRMATIWGLWNALLGRPKPKDPADDHSSRSMLAERAFPDIRRHALRFRFWYVALIIFLFVCLVFTALSYWDTALGTSILQRVDQLERDKVQTLQANPNLHICLGGEHDLSAVDGSARVACMKLHNVMDGLEQSRQDLVEFSNCSGVSRLLFLRCWPRSDFVGRDFGTPLPGTSPSAAAAAPPPSISADGSTIASTLRRFGAYVKAMLFGAPASPPAHPAAAGAAVAPRLPISRAACETIASVLAVFSGYILPMMFGLLGTMVAAIRALHDKIRDSQLAPRDLMLTFTSLPIGAVAGLAVGLFFTTTGTSTASGGGLSGGLSLTAGSLSFLAGYAADAFFSFLDSERGRVFTATNPAAKSRTPPAGVSAPKPSGDPQPGGGSGTHPGGGTAQTTGAARARAARARPQTRRRTAA